jgi:uncharacterized alkaline shock family protein YloU
MSDELVVSEPAGTITVPAATLARIAVRAAELVEGVHVRRPRRNVDVEIAGGSANVSLQLAARYGVVLPDLAEAVQEEVRQALERMCAVEVRRVDIAIEELVER